MFILRLAAYGIVMLLDLSMGLFIITCLSLVLKHEISFMGYALSAFLGVAPDFDFFLLLFTGKKYRRKVVTHHEYPTHWPLLMVPLATAAGWIFGGVFWALAAGIIVFLHFLHDTEGVLGAGDNSIGWLKPFSSKYYGFRGGRLVGYSLEERRGMYADKKAYLTALYSKWLRPTRQAKRELALALMMLAFVGFGLFSWIGLAIMPILVFGGVLIVWISMDSGGSVGC